LHPESQKFRSIQRAIPAFHEVVEWPVAKSTSRQKAVFLGMTWSRHQHHPVDAEFVRDHAVTGREEYCRQRQLDLAIGSEDVAN